MPFAPGGTITTVSIQRAPFAVHNVIQFMISQGVNSILVYAQGFGDADPVAYDDTEDGRTQNRRVELTLAGSGN
jgi:outer membrane protein OmpA-like peptidoglycan-associated protein